MNLCSDGCRTEAAMNDYSNGATVLFMDSRAKKNETETVLVEGR